VTDLVLTVLERRRSSGGGTDVALFLGGGAIQHVVSSSEILKNDVRVSLADVQFTRLCVAKEKWILTSAFRNSMISAEAIVVVLLGVVSVAVLAGSYAK
jgi:hypothetical protein